MEFSLWRTSGGMPEFRDPDDPSFVYVWDPATSTYVRRPDTQMEIPDRSHASGGDNDLFNTTDQTEWAGSPETEGWAGGTDNNRSLYYAAAPFETGDGASSQRQYPDQIPAPEGKVVCPNCRTVTDMPQCPKCGKGLAPEWAKEEKEEGRGVEGFDAQPNSPASEFYSLPERVPKRNRMKTDDSYPSMLSTGAVQWPDCPGCGQNAGFDSYPYARDYLQCNNCGHMETAQDLAARFNLRPDQRVPRSQADPPGQRSFLDDISKTASLDDAPGDTVFPEDWSAEPTIYAGDVTQEIFDRLPPHQQQALLQLQHDVDEGLIHPATSEWDLTVEELARERGFRPQAKLAADWGLDTFSPGRAEVGKWLQDVSGQYHYDTTPDALHEQIAQRAGLSWPQDIGALGSVYNDNTADVQRVFPGFQYDPEHAGGAIRQVFGPGVQLQGPAGQGEEKGQTFGTFSFQGGQWMSFDRVATPMGSKQPLTGTAWVKERSNGVQFDPSMILVAEHLQTEDYPIYARGVKAIVTATGGQMSHAAVLALENGWPVVAGVGTDNYGKIETGNHLILDFFGTHSQPQTITVTPGMTSNSTPEQRARAWEHVLRPRQDFENQNPQYRPQRAAATLEDCPECGGPMAERDGGRFCPDCGHKQKSIDVALASGKMAMVVPQTGERFDGLVVTARKGDELVGYLTATPYGTGYRTDFFTVFPEHRRRGVGTRLIAAARSLGVIPGTMIPDMTYTRDGIAFFGAIDGFHTLSRTAAVRTAAPLLGAIPIAAEGLLGGEAAGGGLMGAIPGLGGLGGEGGMGIGQIGSLMNMATGVGGHASAPPQTGQPAYEEPPVAPGAAMQGMYSSIDSHFMYGAGSFGEEEVGRGTKNDGTNSDPEDASNSGIEGKKEQGDGPEQLKDVGEGSSDRDSNPVKDPYGDPEAWSEDQKNAVTAFEANLPLIQQFADSDESGADHPIVKAIDEMLEEAFPGYKDLNAGDIAEEAEQESVPAGHELEEKLEGEEPKEHLDEPKTTEEERERQAKTAFNELGLVIQNNQIIGQAVGYNQNGTVRVLTRGGYQDMDPSTILIQKGASALSAWDHLAFGIPQSPSTGPMAGQPQSPGQQPQLCPKCGQMHAPGTPCPVTNVSQQPGAGAGLMNPAMTTPISQPGIQPKVVTHVDTGDWVDPEYARVAHFAKWADTEGNPLKEGASYEMKSPNYAIPDYVTIDRVAPDKIEYTLKTGELSYRDQLSAKEMKTEGYEFSPKEGGEDSRTPMQEQTPPQPEQMQQPAAPPPQPQAPPERQHIDLGIHAGGRIDLPDVYRDEDFTSPDEYRAQGERAELMGTPRDMFAPAASEGGRCEGCGETLPDWYDDPESKYRICPSCGKVNSREGEQTAMGHEEAPIRPGQDAIPQVDDLTEPPTVVSAVQGAVQCPKCGGPIGDNGACLACGAEMPGPRNNPTHEAPGHHEGDPGGWMRSQGLPDMAWDAEEGRLRPNLAAFSGDKPDDRAWLLEGAGGGVDVDPELMAKLAGKDYTPREQREFIDEKGEARNLDKLDLAGTHYEFEDDPELALW